jgi:predicted outer membrane repeat protein
MKKSIFLVALSLVLGLFPAIVWGAIWYVDIDHSGPGDGMGWATAFTSIQTGIDAAFSDGGGEVWVAEGSYAEALTIKSNVTVYGGFKGTEGLLSERDIRHHLSVIDAGTAAGGIPAKHAVFMSGIVNARLDGFTITGGRAYGGGDDMHGGGIFCKNLDQTTEIVNCIITRNHADYSGGGIHFNAASPVMLGCLITDNHSSRNQGGALGGYLNSSPLISSCTIRNNSGYGIWFNSGTVVLEDSLIIGNSDWGLSINGGSALINRCTIAGNYGKSYEGGGILAQSVTITNSRISGNRGTGLSTWSTSLIANCLISGNNGATNGGGLVIGRNSTVRNCTIADNEAVKGGGIYTSYTPVIINTILAGNNNWSIYEGGMDSDPQVTSCLFYDNPEGDYFDHNDIYGSYEGKTYTGGNAINLNVPEAEKNISGDPRFISTTSGTWTAPPVYDPDSQTTVLTDASASFVENALRGSLINADTSQKLQAYIIANTSTTITVVGNHTSYAENLDTYHLLDYHLQDGSAALDRGDLAGAPTEDFDGDVRPGSDGLIDIGFDEADSLYLPPEDTAPPESYVPAMPVVTTFRIIEIPFAASDDGSGIQYVELFYRKDGGEWTLYPGRHASSPIIFDTALTGGSGRYEFYTRATDMAGNSEAAPAAADAFSAVIYSFSGERVYVDIDATGLESGLNWENAFRSITAGLIIAKAFNVSEIWVAEGTYSESLVLPDNIMLYGGFAGTEDSLSERDFAANPTIIDAGAADGGNPALHVVLIQGVADTLLDGFTMTGGRANSSVELGDSGGGILINEASGTIRIANCTLLDNYARYGGGAIYADEATLEIENCIIRNNSVDSDGGGIHTWGGTVKISDCVLENNSAEEGGAAYIYESLIELTGSTIRNNTAEDEGGGIKFQYCSGPIRGCDISGNTAEGNGGGLFIYSYIWNKPALRIENSRITNNLSRWNWGGGVYGRSTKLEIEGTLIAGNRAYEEGGGLCLDSFDDPWIFNSIIAGNQAGAGGGGLYLAYRTNFIIRDTVISGNDGGEYGGAMYANYQETYNLLHLPS